MSKELDYEQHVDCSFPKEPKAQYICRDLQASVFGGSPSHKDGRAVFDHDRLPLDKDNELVADRAALFGRKYLRNVSFYPESYSPAQIPGILNQILLIAPFSNKFPSF